MNDALKEQISAFVDGELSESESELLVRRLSQSQALRDLVAEYLTIGRAARGEPGLTGLTSLRDRIAGDIGDGESIAVVEDRAVLPPSRWLRPVAGIGIAATVAAVALLGLQTLESPVSPASAVASNDLAAVAIDEAPLYTEPPVAEFVSDRPSEMLTRYYEQHNERAADLGNSGILARLVELELRGGELVPTASADELPDVSRQNEDANAPRRDQE